MTGQQPEQTATPSQPAAPFFKARILLADTRLNASDVSVRLLPGMTVSTEIKVGNRTVFSYFLYPLPRGLDDAIRRRGVGRGGTWATYTSQGIGSAPRVLALPPDLFGGGRRCCFRRTAG